MVREVAIAETSDANDSLTHYLCSHDLTIETEQLEHLLYQVAKPIIQQIVQRTLWQEPGNDTRGILRWESEDVTGDVLLKILLGLRACKADPEGYAIADFRAWVAAITYRTLTDKRRENDRNRANQEKKIRRLFATNKSLAIWKNQRRTICGYAVWRDDKVVVAASIEDVTHKIDIISLVGQVYGKAGINAAEIVLAILDSVGRPVRLGDLVKVICRYQAAEYETINVEAISNKESNALLGLQGPADETEIRSLIAYLLEDMLKLNATQRKALFLNMANIECFLFVEITTEEQLAFLLDVSPEELGSIFERLPLPDKEIAKLLGIDSVRVTNIRKAVRARLQRRCKGFLVRPRKS